MSQILDFRIPPFYPVWVCYPDYSQTLNTLPVPNLNFSDLAEKAMHDKMVSLVERMLALHKRSPRTPQEQAMVKREVESTDKGIDRLVYELYGLTDEEIKIVES